VSHSRQLGGQQRHRLAPTIVIVRVPGDILSKLVAKAVVALTSGDLSSHPEGPAQSRVAVFKQLRAAAKRARLAGGEIQTAKLQKLTWWLKRRRSPASAKIARALIGPKLGMTGEPTKSAS
jgi:hypothetical protein